MDKSISKFLSLILRHKPETIGISLDEHDWTDVDELLEGIRKTGRIIDFPTLERIVEENDKQRLSFSQDRKKIRANQGHSLAVDLELKSMIPPEVLFHGTVEKFRASIDEKGLIRGNRLYVNLSADRDTAVKVAARRKGEKIICEVAAEEMHREDIWYLQSAEGVACGIGENAMMRRKIACLLCFIMVMMYGAVAMAASAVNAEGYYKDIRLCGRVKIVEHFADIKVKAVDSFPDLRVKVVNSFSDDVGEWQFVEYGEDFTVQFVESFPDIKIKFVNSFPGVV